MNDLHVDDAIADFWLGDSEGRPPNWDGEPRRVHVLRPVRLASGASGTLVRVDPPLPRSDGPPLDEAILVPRYLGHSLENLGDRSISIKVLGPAPGVDIAKDAFADGELIIEFWADAASSRDALPKPIDEQRFWSETLERIKRFIAAHGDSRVPPDYADERGRLDIIVGNLRWHHAGKAGVSPGPFPGIDYAADLDRLDGWEW